MTAALAQDATGQAVVESCGLRVGEHVCIRDRHSPAERHIFRHEDHL